MTIQEIKKNLLRLDRRELEILLEIWTKDLYNKKLWHLTAANYRKLLVKLDSLGLISLRRDGYPHCSPYLSKPQHVEMITWLALKPRVRLLVT